LCCLLLQIGTGCIRCCGLLLSSCNNNNNSNNHCYQRQQQQRQQQQHQQRQQQPQQYINNSFSWVADLRWSPSWHSTVNLAAVVVGTIAILCWFAPPQVQPNKTRETHWFNCYTNNNNNSNSNSICYNNWTSSHFPTRHALPNDPHSKTTTSTTITYTQQQQEQPQQQKKTLRVVVVAICFSIIV
jgi:hypothetical protein